MNKVRYYMWVLLFSAMAVTLCSAQSDGDPNAIPPEDIPIEDIQLEMNFKELALHIAMYNEFQ